LDESKMRQSFLLFFWSRSKSDVKRATRARTTRRFERC
jgi:hypothetical protein